MKASSALLTLLLLAGCTSSYSGPALSSDHPASASAIESPLPPRSRTLEIAAAPASTEAAKHVDGPTHEGHPGHGAPQSPEARETLDSRKAPEPAPKVGFAFPEILVAIHRMYSSGDIDGATETFYRYCPLIRFENQPLVNLALRKHIYYKRGAIASPHVRAPFMPVDEDTLADLEDLWARLNLSSFDSR